MMGFEMMIGKMIGLTPEQMKEKVEEFSLFVKNGSEAMVSIAQNQERILAEIAELKNGSGK